MEMYVKEKASSSVGERIVDIEELCYRGDRALERAFELRAAVERAVGDTPEAHAVVEELFDLIRLGRS